MSDDIKRVVGLNYNRTQEERDDAAWLAREAMALPGFVALEGMQVLYRTLASEENDIPEDGPWRVHRPSGDTDGRWRSGDLWLPTGDGCTEAVFDPDDLATAGLLLYLLGPGVRCWQHHEDELWTAEIGGVRASMHASLGRACIALAATLGRWPNGGRMVAE